jgi:hypothetical protein
MKDDMMTPTNNQFVISYELLHLLQWIVEHGSHELKQLVGKALAAGLRERMHHADADMHIAEEMQDSIVDFFSLLEGLLIETVNEQAMLKAHEKNLMPALEHIDSTVCDTATVRSSLEKATTKMTKNPNANAQQLLFEELLKRWKPNKKAMMN